MATNAILTFLIIIPILPILSAVNELGGILCRQPKNEGYECGVSSPHSAYHFDAAIGECIEFMFKGCGGNQNRFPTKDDCMDGCRSLTLCGKGMPLMDFAGNIKRCEGDRVPCPGSHYCVGHGMNSVCCQKADRICQSSVHAGSPCGVPPVTRYYFDAASKTCRSFAFTGCGGNENNFKSKGECLKFCSSEVICPRGDPHPDRYSINQIASCMEDKHCPRNYTCTAKQGKKGACCPSKEFVCGTPLESKHSCRRRMELDSEPTWTFDFRKGGCSKAVEGVCEDQWNTFANQEQCLDYCVGTCPNDFETHLNPLTNQPQLCDHKHNLGCPLGYECLRSSPFASICCKTEPLCPAAESIVLIKDERAVRCNPGKTEACPDHYTCQQAKNMENICCTKPLSCPSGMISLREDGGRPRVCSIGVEGGCPSDHMCVPGEGTTLGGARHLCCKPERKCLVPYVDMESKRPKRCFPGDGTCPHSTSCLPALEDNSAITNAIDVMFFCCHSVDVFTCSDGSQPLIDENTRRPMTCAPSNPMSCPAEMSCLILMDGTHSCCPHILTTQVCMEALADNDGPIRCKSLDDNTCPEGKCRKALDGFYYCCKTTTETPYVPPAATQALIQSFPHQKVNSPPAYEQNEWNVAFVPDPRELHVIPSSRFPQKSTVRKRPPKPKTESKTNHLQLPSFSSAVMRHLHEIHQQQRALGRHRSPPDYLRGIKRIKTTEKWQE